MSALCWQACLMRPAYMPPPQTPELCAQRQSRVLDGMVDAGYLSEAQAAAVLEEGGALAA